MPARLLAITLACAVVGAAGIALTDVAAWMAGAAAVPPHGLVPGTKTGNLLLGMGFVLGLAFALLYWTIAVLGRQPFEPSRMRPVLSRRAGRGAAVPTRRVLDSACKGLLTGAAYALLVALLSPTSTSEYRALHETTSSARAALIAALVYMAVYGVAGACVLGFMTAAEAPLDLSAAATPAVLLARNRATVVRQALLAAPIAAVSVASTSYLLHGPLAPCWIGRPYHFSGPVAIVQGVQAALIALLGYVLVGTAWGQWLLFTRICLPLTGQLPWATMAFIEDAYQRGVLRQSGAVHQFRHARLQHHLALPPASAE
jgi:hypothetical protein